jgi:hypothetical protein
VKVSAAPTQLVVVGNAIFLSDVVLGMGGERAELTASLGLNLVNWLSGSADLIALRAKRYTNRTLVDKALEDNVKAWKKQVDEGDMDTAAFARRIEESREDQKGRWKRSRWINIVIPVVFIGICAAVAWVLRAMNRASPARIPYAQPPESLAQGGTDS